MIYDPYALKIYVDGSAFDNPGGPGGLAGIVEFPDSLNRDNEVIFEEGYVATTNNRMELLACIRALEYARRAVDQLRVRRVVIISDSMYVNDNHTRAPYWKHDKWKNLDGRPVENSDLWNELLSLRPKVRASTEIQWVRGKTSPVLKEVDRRAKAAAKQPTEIDRGFRGGKVARSKTGGKSASSLFPARGEPEIINIYRKKMASKTEDKVLFDLFSEEQQGFLAKYHAYTASPLADELHRGHRYRVQFNANPKHPMIESIIGEVVLKTLEQENEEPSD